MTPGHQQHSMFMVTGVPQEERAQIDAIQRRLVQKYVQLPPDHVADVVQRVFESFNQSKLRGYVPLLVERRAGEELALSMTAVNLGIRTVS
jgi:hypothetical protein